MSIFSEVVLTWKGREYKIPPHRIMKGIACIEEHFTLADVMRWGKSGSAPLAKLSQGYAALLRYAGVPVLDEEVYEQMFQAGEMVGIVSDAIGSMLNMMIPPDRTKGEKEGVGNEAATVSSAPSSPNRTS